MNLNDKNVNETMEAEILKRLYYEMLRIRMVEEEIVELYPEQEMRCPVHLCIAFPDLPVPTSWALANRFYPKAIDVINNVKQMFDLPAQSEEQLGICHDTPADVPDKTFTGPF